LLLQQEGFPMVSMDLSTRGDGQAVDALCGELDVADAASVAAALASVAGRGTVTRLVDVFSLHASVEQAAGSAGRSRLAAVPLP
jgi:hypothetical protein